jgi:serine/threonine protein kinase
MANLCPEHGLSADVTTVYHATKVLGEGSYGKVFAARHKASDRIYAIKHIKCTEKSGAEEWKGIMNEVKIMKSLAHPNILRLFETYRTAQSLYLVLDLCTGGDLRDWLSNEQEARGDKFFLVDFKYEQQVAHFVHKTLAAVAYMHAMNICHRDLKLDNLMLESRESSAEVIVSDFGLGELLPQSRLLEEQTGTLEYMAPEVLDDSVGYDSACDVWSIGVVAFELLGRTRPFQGRGEGFEALPSVLQNIRLKLVDTTHKVSRSYE